MESYDTYVNNFRLLLLHTLGRRCRTCTPFSRCMMRHDEHPLLDLRATSPFVVLCSLFLCSHHRVNVVALNSVFFYPKPTPSVLPFPSRMANCHGVSVRMASLPPRCAPPERGRGRGWKAGSVTTEVGGKLQGIHSPLRSFLSTEELLFSLFYHMYRDYNSLNQTASQNGYMLYTFGR